MTITIVGSAGNEVNVHDNANFSINLLFETSITGAPNAAAVEATYEAAAEVFAGNIITHETVNIQCGYGDVYGPLNPVTSGAATYQTHQTASVGTIETALAVKDTVLFGPGAAAYFASPAFAAIPSSYLLNVNHAEAKALGLADTNTDWADAYIGVATVANGNYFGTGTPTTGQWDAKSELVHELSEVLGRTTFVVDNGTDGTPLNLFDFTVNASGAVVISTDPAGSNYFSVDGKSALEEFNNTALYKGDSGDWATPGQASPNIDPNAIWNDAFNAATYDGTLNVISTADALTLEALGYTLATPIAPPTPAAGQVFDANNALITI